jgi:DNA-binding protein YbaB
MNMQNLLAQAQKMQRELKKAHEDLAQEEFSVSKGEP